MNTSTSNPGSPKKDEARVEELLREGIDAAKAGDAAKARAKLQEVVALDQYNEKGWYWLASVVETDEEKKVCLGNVVVINPDNERAQQMLDQLTGSESKGKRSGGEAADDAGRRPNRRILLLVVAILVIAAIPILASTILRGNTSQPIPTAAALEVTNTSASVLPGTENSATGAPGGSATAAPSAASETSAVTLTPTRIAAFVTLPPTWTPQPSPTRAGTQTSTPMAPPPPGLTGHLVAVSGTILSRDKSLPLFILDPDGKNMRELTQGDVGDYGLITPDGQRFIYARFVSSTNAQTLRMSGINGTSPVEVSTLWNNQPPLANQQMVNISRNGRVLVFSALSFPENDSTPDIYYVPVKFYPGGEPTPEPTATLGLPPTLAKPKTAPAVGTAAPTVSPFVKVSRVTAKDSGINTWPAPSPDGKLVVFAADTTEKGQGNTDLYVSTLAGGAPKDLTADMPDSSEIAADWSPDGKQIAFQVTPGGSNSSDIYVMNADGSNKVKLVSGLGDNIRPHWSPDGKYIAFSSNRTSKYEIFVIEVASKTTYQVTQTERTTICTFWGV